MPDLPAHMASWERLAARAVHYAFYVLMIVVPLFGWATVSAAPIAVPTMWFGLFEWPHISFLADLPRAQKQIVEDPLATTHAVLAVVMGLLAVLHVAAALKHHFKDRDDVLKHMLP